MKENISKKHLAIVLIILFRLGIPSVILSAEPNEPQRVESLFDMSIEDLMDINISVASKKDEPQH